MISMKANIIDINGYFFGIDDWKNIANPHTPNIDASEIIANINGEIMVPHPSQYGGSNKCIQHHKSREPTASPTSHPYTQYTNVQRTLTRKGI